MKIWLRRTGLSGFTLSLICALSISCFAQQIATPPTHQPVVISYFYNVEPAPINQLLVTVGNQVRAGNTDITLLISSNGGDPSLAFTAYNFLRGLPANITTVNIGNVDSAATILFCAGKQRYALPGTRFLIHGVMFNNRDEHTNPQPNAEQLEANLSLVRNLDEMMIQTIAQNSKKKVPELRQMIQGQVILDDIQAKEWNLIQGTKTTQNFLPPGAQMVGFNVQPSDMHDTNTTTPNAPIVSASPVSALISVTPKPSN